MEFIYLFIGLVIGFAAAWFIAKFKFLSDSNLSFDELQSKYVDKQLYENTQADSKEKDEKIQQLTNNLARIETENVHLQEKIKNHKVEIEEQQKVMRMEFSNLANTLLEEKSKRFVEINEKNMGDILTPLREKIKDFEQKVEENYKEETRERISLKKELELIMKLNQQVSEDASKLTNALKGDKKLQGNWGEIQLEMILEKAGLLEGIHYIKQQTSLNEDGAVNRPDFVIKMPDDKCLILDSKVSLVSYENYYNTDDPNLQAKFMKEHLNALVKHINSLSSKNYAQLSGVNTPDYVLMFVALEPALSAALKEDLSLYEKALEKNIVLVSGSMLLATLRTISYIWKQENQKNNVTEIARESGALYDKFVGFIEDLKKVGKNIDDSQRAYSDAMNKLVESNQKGGTIIGRMERIKKLGANATKSIPKDLTDKSIE